ncbi:uncharacterized protein At1g04910 isoform X1 [Amborella trichopoda]|uniref:O-fucosyltransferase family protein n=1 Tax=Amborella trichopoda TaxID=13333 RepID=W1P197_AMBTC|nr:uncharacterized protein At1g04910 isoform X1 [Amborella trichopoda]XP_020520252.1 uncharacterized protein At1g04910 isoform X1 [Amborella trichopoda]XP_020520253.1 uncharacterized protein At1g04910 isoform X1 [Amborella trichopoda]XP_020520254.1 uncharacterized protein At1g04910 isoform X1 [Amborella trichopoda]XP_020520255.1 uncharacterized protein At1g04910 isoform X1 [Amborella trichopoda]ERN01678.1 hypothetical protein AMTR_s00090p00144090 [Amborella trichopoda]|eukprot:XP_006839109.1 uncharacterized protein At1g04910 isoform X1 [Amborella trichopoda]
MLFKSKIKWVALFGLVLSMVSLLVHLLLAKYSSGYLVQNTKAIFRPDFVHMSGEKLHHYSKLWGPIGSVEALHPYANPRGRYYGPMEKNNGFIYVKIYGGFANIRSSICDVVAVARFLNATLVVPEIQETTRTKGISSKFKSFSYLYNEEQFIAALKSDVIVIKSLPQNLKEARKRNKFPTFFPKYTESPSFYIQEVLPKLKERKVIGLVISDGGCLQPILPSSLAEYQRLRCRVSFNALHFRPAIQFLGQRMVKRLQSSGQPYLAFHSGLVRDTLAYHGCAELFQDVHTELIQARRAQLIKRGFVHGELSVDSWEQRRNGSCPLMPEEVGLLLRAMGYPLSTIIYSSGAEVFGGQRMLIPVRAMFGNLIDRSSLCSPQELSELFGPETPIASHPPPAPPNLSEDRIREWKNAGPRPRPLPPPPGRAFYQHEVDGWYGWVALSDKEPDPSPLDMRLQAHRLIYDALDYIICVEADAFFPGFSNDGSGGPDFASLVMGHRLFQSASLRTYRPDRKILVELFEGIRDHVYTPRHNWTVSIRQHLNESAGEKGLIRESQLFKRFSFLAHPLPECLCRASKTSGKRTRETAGNFTHMESSSLLHSVEDECPHWIQELVKTQAKVTDTDEDDSDEGESLENQESEEGSPESDEAFSGRSSEQDDEMDPDD